MVTLLNTLGTMDLSNIGIIGQINQYVNSAAKNTNLLGNIAST